MKALQNLVITGSLKVSGTLLLNDEPIGSGGSGFPYSGSAVITGSLLVSGSQDITGSLNVSGSITGSLFGTSSYALTSSHLAGISDILEYNSGSRTVWNNGRGNISTNTSFGDESLSNNTTGVRNTSLGVSSSKSNTSGYENVSIGFASLAQNTTGYGNLANGVNTLRLNTTGNENTAVGYYALYSNTTGVTNTAIGAFNLFENTVGSMNFAGGYSALYSNTIGTDNVVIGNSALVNNTRGNYNISLGTNSGLNNQSGSSNIFIGAFTNTPTASGDNQIVIGANAISRGPNTTVIGNSSTLNTYVAGNLTLTGSLNVSGNILLNGEEIGKGGASVIVSSSSPVSQSLGTLWYNTESDTANGGELFIQLQSPTGTTWIPAFDNTLTNSISSSRAISASFAASSSFSTTSISASFASASTSASFALTASSVTHLNQPVTISGSLTVFTGSNTELQVTDTGVTLGNTLTDTHSITGSLRVSGSITGSLFGTASFATNAVTASTTNLSYAFFTFNSHLTNVGDYTPVIGNANGITVSGNAIVIQRTGIYLLEAHMAQRSTFAEYGWVNASNVTLAGSRNGINASVSSTDPAAPSPASGIVSLTAGDTIKIRLLNGLAFSDVAPSFSKAYILQLR